jgi:RNA polymerase sigma factor (sigma-70 family)
MTTVGIFKNSHMKDRKFFEDYVSEDMDSLDDVELTVDDDEHVVILERKSAITSALLTLTPREERVVRMRFGLGGLEKSYTLEEIGQTFCVSMERIRQIQSKALRKLKFPSRSVTLRDFV